MFAARNLLETFSILQIALCFVALGAIIRRGAFRDFRALTYLIGLTALTQAIVVPILFFREPLHLPRTVSYETYFYTYWITLAANLMLHGFIIFGLFNEAMRPFPGLQRIGKIIFRWAASVSLLVAFALATGPELVSKGASTAAMFNDLITRFEQGISVLLLCLLVFVCFAIRPLGLTFRSYMFGVVLGLGIEATVQLVQAAWLVTKGAHSLYSPIYAIDVIGFCISLAIWSVYFGLPEPERRMILLPTTSPFFLWNRISEILGDAPGQVAIAGFTPEMLAPAEIEMLTAASVREAATDREREAALIGGVPALPPEPAFRREPAPRPEVIFDLPDAPHSSFRHVALVP